MKLELETLRTDLGDRPMYDSVSQCNRCGYCEQVCPTYVLTGKEAFSGRGRNQLVRMLLEDKLPRPEAASEALSTCLLCGACTAVCYAHVETVDHVLEGRRRLRAGKSHPVAEWLLRELAERPARFRRILTLAYFFRRLGLSALLAKTGLLRVIGLGMLENAETHVDGAPSRFLEEELAEDPELEWPRTVAGYSSQPAWFYFAPCGPNFLLTEVGKATVRALKRLHGPGAFLGNGCCGLLHYNYGNLETARTLARRVIEQAEAAPRAPIAGDCSSCVAHLKNYPQLFLGEAEWKTRAEGFSRRVRDAVEMYGVLASKRLGVSASERPEARTITYHDSCRARNGQGIVKEPREAVRALGDGGFRELPEAEWCCGGAGAFAFAHPELSDEIARRKVANIASTQASVAATSSTSCLLQLAWALRKYYPECRVAHLSQLVDSTLR